LSRKPRRAPSWLYLRDQETEPFPGTQPPFVVPLTLKHRATRAAREGYARELDERARLLHAASSQSKAFRVVFADLLLHGHPPEDAYRTAYDVMSEPGSPLP
jgi:hypothetical protein